MIELVNKFIADCYFLRNLANRSCVRSALNCSHMNSLDSALNSAAAAACCRALLSAEAPVLPAHQKLVNG